MCLCVFRFVFLNASRVDISVLFCFVFEKERQMTQFDAAACSSNCPNKKFIMGHSGRFVPLGKPAATEQTHATQISFIHNVFCLNFCRILKGQRFSVAMDFVTRLAVAHVIIGVFPLPEGLNIAEGSNISNTSLPFTRIYITRDAMGKRRCPQHSKIT